MFHNVAREEMLDQSFAVRGSGAVMSLIDERWYSICVPQQLASPSGDVMNRYQLRILWFAIGLGSLMLAFPPWQRIGYAFFMDVPRRAEIDSDRLFVQLGILALLAFGAWATAKDRAACSGSD